MVSDRFLLQHRDDPWAVDQLVRRYHKMVRFKATQYFLAGGESDDIVQEGLTALVEAIRAYRPDQGSGFANFATIVVTRRIIDAVTQSRRRKHDSLTSAVPFDSPVSARLADGEPLHLADVIPAPGLSAFDHMEQRARLHLVVDTVTGCSSLEQEALAIAANRVRYCHRPDAKQIDNAIQRARNKIRVALAA